MAEDSDQTVSLRRRTRLMSDHVPRIVDLSLLTIQNRGAVMEGAAPRPTLGSVGSIGADDVLTPADVADVPGSADGAREDCAKNGDDGVMLRYGDENKAPGEGDGGSLSRSGSCGRPPKMSSLVDHQTKRRSVSTKRHSEPTDVFWRAVKTEQLVKRHSGTEGVLRRLSATAADLPRRRSVADLLLRFPGSEDPPPNALARPVSVELPLKRRGERAISSGSSSSDASFHTATQSPMCEAPPKIARVSKTPEPARIVQRQIEPPAEYQPQQQGGLESEQEPKRELDGQPESQQPSEPGQEAKSEPGQGTKSEPGQGTKSEPKKEPGQEWRRVEPPPASEQSRERADSWRKAAGRHGNVSVRDRIGQIERELGGLVRRPGGASRQEPAVTVRYCHSSRSQTQLSKLNTELQGSVGILFTDYSPVMLFAVFCILDFNANFYLKP